MMGGEAMKRIFAVLTAMVVVAAMCFPAAAADDYPRKPITVIVPWGAGGMSDVTGRMLFERMKDILGQPLVVVNKGGAGGVVGIKSLLGAKPDGYTLGSGCIPLGLTAPFFLDAEQFDLDKLSYIGSYTPQERVLFAKPDLPFNTFEGFIAYAKENPGKLSVGSGGAQWALEVIKAIAKKEGLQLKYVLFKGGGDASSAIIGGHVDLCETGTGTPAYQSARDGKLNVIVNLGSDKVPYFPDVKNVIDLGYEYSTMLDYGMIAPAGIPEAIRAKLEDAMKQAMEDKTMVENMTKMGFLPRFLTGKQFEGVCRKAVKAVPELAEYVKDVK
jgi:tripartite-type tricarboxylate transporter receptor subunit TctC